MVKKVGVKKKRTKKKALKVKKSIPSHKTPQASSHKASQTEKILVENFVSLQKVITNLSIKFDKLTNQISSLLELFEVSAKTLAEKESGSKKSPEENKENKEIIEKMDSLLEQNRTIARGVALMHEKSPELKQRYPPQRVMQNQMPRTVQDSSKYQRSTPI